MKKKGGGGMKTKEDLTFFFFPIKGFHKLMMAWLDQCMHSTKKICGTLPCNLWTDKETNERVCDYGPSIML